MKGSTRLERAERINSNAVTLLGHDAAWVESQSDSDKTYTVELGDDPSCTCPDHIYRNETCKHICAAAQESPSYNL